MSDTAHCAPCNAQRDVVGTGNARRFLSHAKTGTDEFCEWSGVYLDRAKVLEAWPCGTPKDGR